MNSKDFIPELIEGMEKLAKEGFTCYIVKDQCYGFIITPNDNVIYIQRDTFVYRGWTTSLQYVPSQKTGTGCQCLEEPFQDITADIILQSEKEGLQFARKLKAMRYNSSDEWLNKYWDKSRLQEIK